MLNDSRGLGVVNKSEARGAYHDAVAGPRGEVNVVWVAGHAAVPSLNVAGHILTHGVYALTGTVGTCGRVVWRQHMPIRATL